MTKAHYKKEKSKATHSVQLKSKTARKFWFFPFNPSCKVMFIWLLWVSCVCNIHITKIHILENKVVPIQDGNVQEKSLQRKTKKTCGDLPWILNKFVKVGTSCEGELAAVTRWPGSTQALKEIQC